MECSLRRWHPPLWQQIILASLIGVALGLTSKEWGINAKYLGDIFIRMIQMTIIPLIFPLIVLGIAKMHSGKSVGRLAFKGVVYFEVVTTVLLIMSVGLVNFLGTGKGVNLAGGDAAVLDRFASKSIDFAHFIAEIIPKNIVQAMAGGDLLPVLFFGIIFGVALGAIGEKGKPIIAWMESLSETMFKLISYVIALSPMGVFGFVAYSFAAYGWEKVASLVDLVIVVYLGLGITLFIIFPLIGKIFHVPYFKLIGGMKDIILIVASTRSSEAVLAPSIARLCRFGVKDSAVSFILPLGYSFNLDGGSVYFAPAILFVANAFGIDLSLSQQIQLIITLMLLSKGIAGVVGANFVVLTSVATMFGLPLEGVALLFAIDWVTDIGRTVTNVIGNALATVVIAKSENMVDETAWKEPATEVAA